jgi:lipid-binding SYLF domain-containing protein
MIHSFSMEFERGKPETGDTAAGLQRAIRSAMAGFAACALITTLGSGCATAQGDTAEEKRAYVHNMKREALTTLYAENPAAKESLEKSEGYAVFSNINIKIFALGSGNGFGISVDNKSGTETFMRMAEVGVGLGLGAKDIRTVLIFHDRDQFHKFVEEGWSFGAEAAAAAKSDDKGGAAESEAAFVEGIEIYQLTDAGLMASAMVSGTKYWKDKNLH